MRRHDTYCSPALQTGNEGNIPSFTSTSKHENIDEPRGRLQVGRRAYTFLSRSYRARYREHNDLS
jgi:hypothetical protein